MEGFLAKIAGDADAPASLEPKTRKEHYLAEIAAKNSMLTIDLSGDGEESEIRAEYTEPDAIGESGYWTVTGLDPESVYAALEGGSLIWLGSTSAATSGYHKTLVTGYEYSSGEGLWLYNTDGAALIRESSADDGDDSHIGDLPPVVTPGGNVTINLPGTSA